MVSARTVAVRAALVTVGILAVAVGTISGDLPAPPLVRPDRTPELPGIDFAPRAPAPAPIGATPPAAAPTNAPLQESAAPTTPTASAAEAPPAAAAPPATTPAPSPEPPSDPAEREQTSPSPSDPASDVPAGQVAENDEDGDDDERLRIRIAGVDAEVESDLFDSIFG